MTASVRHSDPTDRISGHKWFILIIKCIKQCIVYLKYNKL